MNNNGLISRQTAIDKLFEYAESKFQSGEIELANGILKAKCFLESPCNIPTAYDVDKVVERIQKIPFRSASVKARIIHIVKGGGTDGMHIWN